MKHKKPRGRRLHRKPRRMSLDQKTRLANFVKSQPRMFGPTFVLVHKRHSAPPFMFLTDQETWPGTPATTRSLARAKRWTDRTSPYRFLRKFPYLRAEFKALNLSGDQTKRASKITEDTKIALPSSQAA